MTIAACYLSPEGVVFGADSTTTMRVNATDPNAAQEHYFTFGQKIFELGQHAATLGIVTWGLGGFPQTSFRTLYAEFADDLAASPPQSVEEAAQRWAAKFFSVYDAQLGSAYRAALAASKTDDEREHAHVWAQVHKVGFCIGGFAPPTRRPAAYELSFSPTGTVAPSPELLPVGRAIFRGVPMLIERMLFGLDFDLYEKILASPHWTGGEAGLEELVKPFVLGQPPPLPLREAIDWVYSCIQSTIKGVKFSPFAPMCGGPVEIAVITSDRPFRWVRHKSLDVGIADGVSGTHPEAI